MLEKVSGSKNSSAAILATKGSAGVTWEVNLRNSLYASDEACKWGIYPGFETQDRHHQKSKTGESVARHKGLMFRNFLTKRDETRMHSSWMHTVHCSGCWGGAGGMYPSMHWAGGCICQTPPPLLWREWLTVKTLPCRNYVVGGN